MARYERECRIRFRGDVALAQRHVNRARKVLDLLYKTNNPGVTTARITRQVLPGITVDAQLVDGDPIITITAKHDPQSHSRGIKATGEWWVPEGFVFYPATDTSPNGWGLPVQYDAPQGTDEIDKFFLPQNLRPGLDVSRWTPGGALGQVLVTKKPNAGYPPLPTDEEVVVVTPGLYHPEHGPHPTSLPSPTPPAAQWRAYRMEFVDYDANAEVATPDERNEIKRWKKDQFRLHNEHRANLGLKMFLPPVRGSYDSAQATSEWNIATKWWGHNCAGFPDTWKLASGRIEKNNSIDAPHPISRPSTMRVSGYNPGVENIFSYMTASAVFEYVDHTNVQVLSNCNFSPTPAQDAFDGWLASPPHRAAIEREASALGVGYSYNYDFGYHSGACTMHYLQKYQWISCGNRYWHSRHEEIPTLSWYGPDSKNLNDEFWRVRFVLEADPNDPQSNRVSIAFSEPVFGTTANDGRICRRPMRHGKRNDGLDRTHAFLGPCIFARGRVIAIAPDKGFVLAAAMYKPPSTALPYRLLALCIHPDDQPTDPWEGFTPIVRLWWCDLPHHVVNSFNGVPTECIAGNPRAVVRTKYGDEEHNWPYVDRYSPYSWRGGEAIYVNSSGLNRPPGDLLSYASLWEFNDTATKAVCLRNSYDRELFDYGHYNRDTDKWSASFLHPANFSMPFRSSATMEVILGIASDVVHISGTPVYCELSLDHWNNSVNRSIRFWLHNPRNEFIPSNAEYALLRTDHWYANENVIGLFALGLWITTVSADGGQLFWEKSARATPVYAFYVGDEVRAVYNIETNMCNIPKTQWEFPPGGGHLPTNFAQTRRWVWTTTGVHYQGVATGPSVVDDDACKAMVANATLYSAEIGARGVNVMSDYPIVLHADANHTVFAAAGVDCPIIANEAELPDDYPFNLYPTGEHMSVFRGAFSSTLNPNWNRGDVVETNRDVIQFDLYINGSRVRSQRLSNPEAKYVHKSWLRFWYDADLRNTLSNVFVSIPYRQWNTCWAFTGGFVKNRSGEWAVAINLGQQWGVLYPQVYMRSITDPYGQEQKAPWPNNANRYTDFGATYNVGGFMLSSFASQQELSDMMQLEGDNPRSHYVRLV